MSAETKIDFVTVEDVCKKVEEKLDKLEEDLDHLSKEMTIPTSTWNGLAARSFRNSSYNIASYISNYSLDMKSWLDALKQHKTNYEYIDRLMGHGK